MKLFNLLIFLFLFNYLQAQLIPNGGFEQWSGSPEIPVSWYTMGVDSTISRSTNYYTGSYALKLDVVGTSSDCNNGVVQSGSSFFQGIPITGKPIKLSGFYQFNCVNSDTGLAAVYIMKGNSYIGYGQKLFLNSTYNYTTFDVPIFYFSIDSAESAVILLTASSNLNLCNNVGSWLLIDDLSFHSSVIGIDSTKLKKGRVTGYSNTIHIEGFENRKAVKIFDVSGQLVTDVSSENSIHIGKSGLYIVQIFSEGKIFNFKVIL